MSKRGLLEHFLKEWKEHKQASSSHLRVWSKEAMQCCVDHATTGLEVNAQYMSKNIGLHHGSIL
jgi:hypothetical protein